VTEVTEWQDDTENINQSENDVKEIFLFQPEDIGEPDKPCHSKYFYSQDVPMFNINEQSVSPDESGYSGTGRVMERDVFAAIRYEQDKNPDDSLIKKRRGSEGIIGSCHSPHRSKVI